MNAEMTLSRWVDERIAQRSLTRNILIVVAASIIIALSAQLSIHTAFSPVPFTMQPLALLVVGAILGPRRGAAAAALYVAEGVAGLPVFAGGAVGAAVLFGPRGGFLLAFPVAAFIAGLAASRFANRTTALSFAIMLGAIATLYLGGWSWMAGFLGLGAKKAFTLGVAPFIAMDVIKALIATLVIPAARPFLNRER